MQINKLCIFYIVILNLCFYQSRAQVQKFNMMDTTVNICKGDLYDSGGPGFIYGNNENFTFRICTGSPISMSFTANFCVETSFDKLRFFDGPDTLSSQIGSLYSGNLPPPMILASSGCLTVNFVSDSNVAYCGWEGHWTAPVIPPIPPTVNVAPAPVCNSKLITLTLSKPVQCDSIRASDFTISGPMSLKVLSAIGLSCVNNKSNTIQLSLDKPISQSCNYNVLYICRMHDNCDSIWTFKINSSFFVNTCPFTVSMLAAEDTICPGSCTSIKAVVAGCQNYTYKWNNGLPSGPGPFLVCPSSSISYSVFVQETGGTGYTGSAVKNISVLNPKIGISDTTVCQSDTSFVISASPPGGYWIGKGMTDTIAGIFTPDSAGPGIHYIKYVLGKLCRDSVKIKVKPMDVGLNDAACPFSAPYFLNGYKPSGGIWTGDSILLNGLFSPADTGVYKVTYSFKGCSETKYIYVNTVSSQLTDTICQSVRPFNIKFYPPGGRWYGQGITDSLKGTFMPDAAGGGLHKPVYYLHGCRDTFPIFIKAIQAGYSFSACPLQPAFIIMPAASPLGGFWTGNGISNPLSGLYDPAMASGISNDMLIYKLPNACNDTLMAYLEQTKIYIDSLFFCKDDGKILLDYTNTHRSPGGGIWSGSGVVNISGLDYFDPAIAGPGSHQLTYLVNTCSDTMTTIVYPALNVKDTFFCTITPPFQLQGMPPGGYWKGFGVIDSLSGIFDASVAGADTQYVKFITPACIDSVRIIVYQYSSAKISGLDSIYCFMDTNILIGLSPPAGIFLADSSVVANTFNPSKSSVGYHTFVYSFGSGSCKTIDSIRVHVMPPLKTILSISNDTICKGEGAKINIIASGGKQGAVISYQWSNGLFPVSSHTVSPPTSTTYTIITSDGCSTPMVDTARIFTNPVFGVNFSGSSIDCYGTKAYAKADVIGSSSYDIEWGTSPIKKGDSVIVNNGKRITVIITDMLTGCHLDTLIDIPGFSVMKALFSVNPNMDCISFEENPITFIDESRNVKTGNWNFGNGQSMNYVRGENPQINYEPGDYTVNLTTYNEGGCKDLYSVSICVFGPEAIFVPDAFSPNGDGQNDVLFVRGTGIKKLDFRIYDRWGENVFSSIRCDDGWDGNYRGKSMDTGVYYYYLQATLFNNKEVSLKGDISIIK